MTYSLDQLPTLKPDNFEVWKASMIEAFKQLNAWYLIENRVALKIVEETGDDRQIKNYQDLSLKVEYLLRSSLSKEDNKLVKESTVDDIYTAWFKLVEKYETINEKSKNKSLKKLDDLIEEGTVDIESVDDYIKKKVKKLTKKYLKKYAKSGMKEGLKIDDSSDDDDNLVKSEYIEIDGDDKIGRESATITIDELLSFLKTLTKTYTAKKLIMEKLEQSIKEINFS